MLNIIIDNKPLQTAPGTTIIEAARLVGIDIPHFCDHPALTPDGNCRMCLVEVNGVAKPVLACKTLVHEGMEVKTDTDLIKKARASIMEFLLINHPLDCPTCDQAGECKLQDYYMIHDASPSRFAEKKVTKRKRIDLGAGVVLDEERCVLCRRCVRFCQQVAKRDELSVQGRGDQSFVSTFPDKPLTSPYAGCVVDICPVGALTSKDFRFKKRVWYLLQTDSICPGCSRGCHITLWHEKGVVYRITPRFCAAVNQYWMCDVGRHDYRWLNEQRRFKAMTRVSGRLIEASVNETLLRLKQLFESHDPFEVAFVASAKETSESIDAFVGFTKKRFGADFVYYSKKDPPDPVADDFLVTRDKNPNLAHIYTLGLKTVDQMPQDIKAVVVQRDLSERDESIVRRRGIEVLALLATNHTMLDDVAQVVLPVPTYAEQAGSFTNNNGCRQSFVAAFVPREGNGEAVRLVADWMNVL
ncbi:MAG: hypothetical protein ACD_62C00679G0001 [uncultured bacterium]|nr:MAG: hypothetical protein ACD_62C00679G0001 [uncultured bacterium]